MSNKICFILLPGPTISLHPQSVVVSSKQNITMVSFACKAVGSPPPEVTWLKNNSTQPNATVLEIDGISWLILVLVEKKNSEDSYVCVARSSEGEAYSTEAMVVITVPGADNNLSAVAKIFVPLKVRKLHFRSSSESGMSAAGYRAYLLGKSLGNLTVSNGAAF